MCLYGCVNLLPNLPVYDCSWELQQDASAKKLPEGTWEGGLVKFMSKVFTMKASEKVIGWGLQRKHDTYSSCWLGLRALSVQPIRFAEMKSLLLTFCQWTKMGWRHYKCNLCKNVFSLQGGEKDFMRDLVYEHKDTDVSLSWIWRKGMRRMGIYRRADHGSFVCVSTEKIWMIMRGDYFALEASFLPDRVSVWGAHLHGSIDWPFLQVHFTYCRFNFISLPKLSKIWFTAKTN